MVEKGENKLSLSKKVQVSHTTVKGWLQGAKPSSEYLPAISRALCVNTQWLLTGTGEKFPESHGIPAEIAETLSAGTRGAAQKMSKEELHEVVNRWWDMYKAEKLSPMRLSMLENLRTFISELILRENTHKQ